MARTKSLDYDRQRDAILELAVRAFAELGYPSASMSELARACGTSKARLYHYFPSKEALLFDALDRYTRRLAERVQAVAAQRLPPRAELTELVRTLMREYRDSRAYHVALLNDVKFLSPQQRERIKAQEREVVDALGRTLARVAPQRFGGPGSRPATMALLGMINFTFAWLRPDGPMTYEQYADLVVDLWLNGAVSPAAPIATPKPTIVSEPQ